MKKCIIFSRPELLANITLSGGNMKVKRIFFLLLLFGPGQFKTKKILYFFFSLLVSWCGEENLQRVDPPAARQNDGCEGQSASQQGAAQLGGSSQVGEV
jgi:hypothetical protein